MASRATAPHQPHAITSSDNKSYLYTWAGFAQNARKWVSSKQSNPDAHPFGGLMRSLMRLAAVLLTTLAVAPAGLAAPTASLGWHVLEATRVGRFPTDLAFGPDGRAWVANFGDGTVSVLGADGRVTATWPAGPKPRRLAIAPDGTAWVANWGANTLTHLGADGALLGRYPVGALPNSVAVDAAGRVWVANMGAHSVMRLSGEGRVEASCRIERPSSLAIDAAGRVWVTSLTAQKDNVVRLTPEATREAAFTVPPMPERVTIDAQGGAWVSHMVGNAARRLTRLGADGRLVGLWTGLKSQGVAIDGEGVAWVANTEYVIDGERGYLIANPLTNTVTRVSPGGRLLGTYSAGADAWLVKPAPSGEIWVVNHLGGSVSRLSR
jgi:DNA-binding beta-propeller fold protein YncE